MSKVNQRRIKGKGKGVNSSTKFDRELKKLKWTVKDKGSIKVSSQGKGARVSFAYL